MMVSSSSIRKVAVATAVTGLAAFSIAAPGLTGASASSDPQPKVQAKRLAASGADKFVDSRPAALHASKTEKFVAGDVISSHGTQYVPYQRTYRGLPVIGGDFVVVTDRKGKVVDTSVAQDRKIAGLATSPKISASKAGKTAQARLARVVSKTKPRLVVHTLDRARLAWETTVAGTKKGGQPSRQTVYVDALTGKVFASTEHVVSGEGDGAYSGPDPLALDTTGSGSEFSLADPAVTSRVCQDADTSETFTGPDDTWGNGDATDRETGCVDGFYASQLQQKMLKEWLGRDGMDGEGNWVPLRVGLDDINAYYDGTQVQIGHSQAGKWISSLDVVAHEFGHGIDDKTPGGISNGGTQEFVADVFGALTEAYADQPEEFDEPDYLVGEEVDLVGSGPIRNMYDPSQVDGDPNCYSDEIPDMGVHTAAGPGNHWFYLLAEGNKPEAGPESPICEGGPEGVTGIGPENAGKILYNAMLLKTSDSSYLKYRTWTLEAAKTLFPDSCAEFDTVKAAWDAVSVPAQSDEPTCEGGEPTDPPDPTEPPDPTDPPASELDFTGVAALNNCSASIVRYDDSAPTDKALGLTNGHCYEGGMPGADEVLVDQPSNRAFTLLGADGSEAGEATATKLLYATMTKTDVSLYELDKTYEEIAAEVEGFEPLTLAKESPADGTASKVVSGYWQKIYDCSVEKTVHQLKEADWTMEKSIKYVKDGCETIGGTSGSPIVSTESGEVIGVNNTGNEDGQECTMNNPCEVDENGEVTVDQGAAYGQQTAWFYTCLAEDNTLDLTKEGCELPAPAAS